MKIPDNIPVKRITLRTIGEEILAQFNLEKGIGYTIKGLLLRPRAVMEEYLFHDRHRLMRPLPLVILVVTVTTFFALWYLPVEQDIGAELHKASVPETLIPALEKFMQFSKQYYNVLLLSAIPTVSLATFLLFRSSGLNYAEHLIINMYIYAMQTILTLPFFPFLLDVSAFGVVVVVLSAWYYLYAYRSVFQTSWGEVAWKTVGVLIVSQTLQSIVFGVVFLVFWLVL
jgi:hypothetical protein